jgi:hypothetical protein
MGRVGTRAFHTPNFHTTIVIKLALRWHPLRLCTNDSAGPHCSGVRSGKAMCLDLKCWRMSRGKFRWSGKAWRLHSCDRRVMLTNGEETSHSMWAKNLLKRPFYPYKLLKPISFDPELPSVWFLCPNSQNSSLFLFLHSYILLGCCIVFIYLLYALL